MQISTTTNYSSQKSPAFGGATKIFKSHLLYRLDSFDKIMQTSNTNFVGTLPREILQKIIQKSASPEEKKQTILEIMQSFSRTAKLMKKIETANLMLTRPIMSIISKITNSEDIVSRIRIKEKTAENVLTKAFKKSHLIGRFSKIKVRLIGIGGSGQAYAIYFPKKTGFKPKVLKIFDVNDGQKVTNRSEEIYSGCRTENNAMVFIRDKYHYKFDKAKFTEGYLGSLKDNFMLSEHAKNYKYKKINPHFKIFNELGIIACDMATDGNVVNGRLVDYGYILPITKRPFWWI